MSDQPTSRKKVAAPAAPAATTAPSESKSKSKPDSKAPTLGITMLADRVLVHIPNPDGERRSKGGLLIPATAQASRRLAWAEVVAIGPGVRLIQLGDRVLFNPEDRYEVEVGGEDYLLLRERDIHGVAADRSDGATGLYL
jgi:chaperonin GroES